MVASISGRDSCVAGLGAQIRSSTLAPFVDAVQCVAYRGYASIYDTPAAISDARLAA